MTRSVLRSRLSVDVLEARDVPSTLNWINRGQTSDRFQDVFGTGAEAARKVVDSVLQKWSDVLVNLNQPGGGNTVDFTVQMAASGASFTSSAEATNWNGGYPTAGLITMGRGQDVNGDGLGDGAGWFIDPTPDDSVEFTQVINSFAAAPVEGSPAFGKTDFYNFINSEIVHALGLFGDPAQLQAPVAGTLTPLNQVDPEYNLGFLYVFDGPSITLLMTSNNGGSAPNGQDFGKPVHTAGPKGPATPIAFNSQYRGGVRLTGGVDCGNATDADSGPRVLVPDNLALLLKDAYGMTVKLPSTLPNGTFRAQLNATTGQLTVVGGEGDSADQIRLSRTGSDLEVSADPSKDGAVPSGLDDDADGNAPPVVSRFPFAAVRSVRIVTGDGNDRVTVDASGGDPIPAGGMTSDEGAGTDVLVFAGGGTYILAGDRLTVPGVGTLWVYGDEEVDLTGGPGVDTFNVRNFAGTVVLDGGDGDDTYNVVLRGAGEGLVDIFDAAGNDQLRVTGSARADDITVSDTELALASGETIRFDSTELERLILNTGLGDDVVALSGFLATTRIEVNGGAGNDAIDATGFVGLATLIGGFGADTLVGGSGDDVLRGGFGNDAIDGGAGNDLVDGGFGDDQLVGGAGQDTVLGGAGDDQIDTQDDDADLVDGGIGQNWALVDGDLDQVRRVKRVK